MPESISSVAMTAIKTYAAYDLDAFLNLLTDDIVYALYLDEDELPFAGETEGKAVLRSRIEQMHAAFEYVLFRPFSIREVGDTAHNQIEFIYRHRATGEELSGRFRFVLTVRDALVSRIEEYHDAERVKAFARLIGGV